MRGEDLGGGSAAGSVPIHRVISGSFFPSLSGGLSNKKMRVLGSMFSEVPFSSEILSNYAPLSLSLSLSCFVRVGTQETEGSSQEPHFSGGS